MFFKIHIRRHERGLWFRKGDFHKLLGPGTHYNWGVFWNSSRDIVQVVDTLKTRFSHEQLEVLARAPQLRDELLVLDLADGQRAIVWKDARLLGVLGPGLHALWKSPAKLEVEVYAIDQFRFEHAKLSSILAQPDAARWFDGVMVGNEEDVILFRDGVMIDRLGAGLHVFWKGTGKVTWKTIDCREQVRPSHTRVQNSTSSDGTASFRFVYASVVPFRAMWISRPPGASVVSVHVLPEPLRARMARLCVRSK